MPALPHVDLSVESHALTTTANDVMGTSGALTDGATYLFIGELNASTTGGSGTDVQGEVHIGATAGSRTRFAMFQSEHAAFSPSGALGSVSNGGLHNAAFAFTYTPGAGEEYDAQAWGGAASGEGHCHVTAIDVSNIPSSGALQARYHEETANSDTIVTTPGAAAGYVTVGNTMTETTVAGDHVVFACAELVADGTAAATDEFDARLMVDGVEESGTVMQINVGGRADTVVGYFAAREVNLTAASHDIEIEVNGTSAGGNIGARRVRLHLLESDAFAEADVVQATDAGETITGTSSSDPAGLTDTIGNGSDDWLVISQWQKQVAFWSQGFLLVGGTETPTEGFGVGCGDFGTGATDDMNVETGIAVVSAPASSTAIGARVDKVGGGGASNYGGDCARAAGGDMALITMRLAYEIRGGMAATVVVPTMSSSGTVGGLAPSGTLAGTMLVPTMAASGDVLHTGSMAGDMLVPTLAAAGDARHEGTFAATMLALELAAAGAPGRVGSLAASMLPLELAASGNASTPGPSPTGTMGATMLVAELAAAGAVRHVGTLGADLLPLVMNADGSRVESGPFAGELPLPELTAGGGSGTVGSMVAEMLVLDLAAAGQDARTAQLAASLLVHLLEASGVATGEATGTFGATLPVLLMSGAGSATGAIGGTLAASIPILILSAGQRSPRRTVTIAPTAVVNAVISSRTGNTVIPGDR